MKYLQLNECSFCDGPGARVTLFVSACTHRCPGCHNPESWNADSGSAFTNETVSKILELASKQYIKGLTLSGGDPLAEVNRSEIYELLKQFKSMYPTKDVWLYTGYEWEELQEPIILEILKLVDVAVVGRFELDKRDVSYHNMWRGSTNQRLVDCKKSISAGSVILFEYL
jgi:anaerobic ribonucleoside-triphosphate reductase activating protein